MDKLKTNLNGINIKKQEQKIFLVFILALLLYLILILLGDMQKITLTALNFNWFIIPILLVFTLLNYLFRAIRFYFYLRQISINIPFASSLRIFLSGLSMTITPGKTGEIVKAYLVKKMIGNKFAEIVPLLIIERATDGIAMIILGVGGIFLLERSYFFFLFSAVFVSLFFLSIKAQKQILQIIIFFEKKYPRFKLIEFFEIFFINAQKLLTIKSFIIGLSFALISWFFEGLLLFLIIKQFISVDTFSGLLTSLFIFSFSSIAGFFALIPGGIGIAEGSITYFLNNFLPLNLSEAVFVTILFRFLTLWFGVLLGLINLLYSFNLAKKDRDAPSVLKI